MPANFTGPVGRIVQGDAFEPQLTDQQGKPRIVQSGPRAGQPSPQWFLAMAYAKNDPAWPPHWAALVTEAAQAWPSLFPQGPMPQNPPGSPNAGGCVLPSFAFKVIDGDGYDTTGKSNATKEGFAGHWVVRYTSGFAPKVYKPNGGAWIEISDRNEIKRGYYARVAGTFVTNGNATKPGLHVNVGLVELAGQGPEIISGPSAQDAFGAPAQLPAGATPLPASATPLPVAPPPGVPYTPPAAPVVAAPPPVAPPAAPYAGFMLIPSATMPPGQTVDSMKAAGWTEDLLVQHGYATRPVAAAAPVAPPAAPLAPPPPAAPVTPPPPAAPVHVMTPKAAGQTYEAMIAAGWNDAQLIQHGYMQS